MDRDLVAELDSIKAEIEAAFGKDDPQELKTVITPLSRLEERFLLLRQSLEEVLSAQEEEE